MKNPEILFISGSLGLGHITRDLAIANKLREKYPEAKIKWLATHPATLMLEDAHEILLPEASEYANDNVFAEQCSNGNNLNLLKYLLKSKNAWQQNVRVFGKVMHKYDFDLVIGDETYEIAIGLRDHPDIKTAPVVILYDFVGLDSMTLNPLEKIGVYMWNRKWSYNYRKKITTPVDMGIFIGRLDDVPDKSFGFLLPNRRDFAEAMFQFAGYITPFDVSALPSKNILRKKYGYNNQPLVVAAVGGTSIGQELLELCGKAFLQARKKIPGLQMTLITGPRIKPDFLDVPEEVEVQPFVPKLYEYFAASDLAIVQGGATSIIELTAMNKPFIYFPVEQQCEQANIASNLRKNNIGVGMKLSGTTPDMLSDQIVALFGKKINYPEIPLDGARRVVELMEPLLEKSRGRDLGKQKRGHWEDREETEKLGSWDVETRKRFQ